MKIHLPSALLGAILISIVGLASAFQSQSPCCLTTEQKAVLALLSVQNVNGCNGTTHQTLRVTGANFQVVNGLGTTSSLNGLGNIIVGYGSTTGTSCGGLCDDTGSHNLILGTRNGFTSYSCILSGNGNTANGPHISILSGQCNYINGSYNSCLSGNNNITNANAACFISGTGNTINNSSTAGTIIGGESNIINQGTNGVITGGQNNLQEGDRAVISGGANRSVSSPGSDDWVAGSLFEDN